MFDGVLLIKCLVFNVGIGEWKDMLIVVDEV